jgi:hypothetical protein
MDVWQDDWFGKPDSESLTVTTGRWAYTKVRQAL